MYYIVDNILVYSGKAQGKYAIQCTVPQELFEFVLHWYVTKNGCAKLSGERCAT